MVLYHYKMADAAERMYANVSSFFKYIIERIYLSFNDNLVYYDSVTRCRSRFYYDTVICPKYEKRECVVVFVDINDLKYINDTYGHQQGTEHIKNIAEQLKALPNVVHVCRVGGDEFLLIGNTRFEDVSLRQIRGISYGAVLKHKSDTLHDVIKKADSKMYDMKRAMKKP